ncbi:MAG: hypothetical protein QM677_04980 [Microbacterium sp.]
MTLAQVEALFVDTAPFEGDRRDIWEAFKRYTDLLGELLPGSTLIIDGSFTTWNDTRPPHDIDFAARIDMLAYAALPTHQAERLKHLREASPEIDAHVIPDWDDTLAGWVYEIFSAARDVNGRRIHGERKGVIEVTL